MALVVLIRYTRRRHNCQGLQEVALLVAQYRHLNQFHFLDTSFTCNCWIGGSIQVTVEHQTHIVQTLPYVYILWCVMFWWKIPLAYLPRAHAQRCKVIGPVVVVVSTKIASSRILGEFASANLSPSWSLVDSLDARTRVFFWFLTP